METQTCQLGHSLQGFQPLWQQHRICSINRRYGQRGKHIAVVVDDGDDFFATLMFMARVANAIPSFFGHRVGAITMQDSQIESVASRQMPHTGDKGMFNRAVIGPFGKDFVDGGIVDFGLAIAVFGHGQTLPLHARIEHPQDEVEEAMIAEFAPGSTLGHGKVGQDKFVELGFGELHGNGCRCWFVWRHGHEVLALFEDGSDRFWQTLSSNIVEL
jgi:hypothetical protein